MERGLRPSVLVLLLLCPKLSHSNCPSRCQCFTPAQVLCADEHMTSVPGNISREAEEVIIMTSAVQYLFPAAFEGSPRLHKLILLNNPLQSIHSRAFQNLSALRELEISGNPRLEHLFLGTFSQQEKLTKLQLNHNRFHSLLPGMFHALRNLRSLQIKANVISQVPAFLFGNLGHLRALDLSLNKIQKVEGETFSGLTALEVLQINGNQISNLSSDTFRHVAHLTELHLEGNTISQLADGTFSALANLKVLNLRGNRLVTFSDGAFARGASNLTHLDLRGNRLTRVSSLRTLTSLTDLLLSSNQLAGLPEDLFRNVTSLENVDLSGNKLARLPERIFAELRGIKTIHLHNNRLSRLESRLFQDQEFIQQLYLSDNQLQNLPLGLLDHFALPHMLRLHGNPWRCDCHVWYLHDFVLNNNRGVEAPDRVLCESPDFLRRRPLASVGGDELLCRLPEEETSDPSGCTLRKSSDSLVITCKAEKCGSPSTVKVEFLERDGSTREHVWKSVRSQCSNATASEAAVP